jgi:LAO/AO transport system kinase
MENEKPNKSALSVSEGVIQPPSVNPNFNRAKRRHYTVEQYTRGILSGDRTLLSRAITLIESNHPDHAKQAQEIIEKCLPHSGKSLRIGITGVPGVGKSTFIETIGMYVSNLGHKLAVLAIDPSSERSKGSILGDKTRMEELSANQNAFIRPSPSAGSLGGVARKTRESILLCEAAGFDVIFIETVGVGQSETAVHSMVDFFLLLMLAGAGDELQGIKRGIMEMADMIAITKADGVNVDKATRAQSEYKSALHLFPPTESGWFPKVVICSARSKLGIEDLWMQILEYQNKTQTNGFFEKNRKDQSRYWMTETIHENKEIQLKLDELENEVLKDRMSSFTAAQKIMDQYFRQKIT